MEVELSKIIKIKSGSNILKLQYLKKLKRCQYCQKVATTTHDHCIPDTPQFDTPDSQTCITTI